MLALINVRIVGCQLDTTAPMDYRREIDGLRALAVIPVILFHAGVQAFGGGFVGVDIFFVISGYLITSIILAELAGGKFSIVNFYERRARRILPALFFVMAMCVPVAWIVLSQTDLISFSKSVVAVPLFLSNVFFWRDGGYFESAAELKPLLHTWSLAVEEQYYVVFPIFLMLTWRFGRKWILALLVVGTVLSLGLAQWGAHRVPVPSFFLLPTRAWELAIGAIVAFYLSAKPELSLRREVMEGGALLGLAMVFVAMFSFDESTPFPGMYALVPTVGTALIILCAYPTTLVGRLLGTKAFVSIGLISYSAYLWHQPLFAFTRYHFIAPGMAVMAGLSVATFLLAWFSWRYVERPFRLRQRFSRSFVFTFSLIGSLVFIGIGCASVNMLASSSGAEAQLAKALTQHPVVYASNMDDRKFVKYRMAFDPAPVELLVVGSSRAMQLGSAGLNLNIMNLSVSGASMEDHVAITDMAVSKLKPGTILLGADPWLFNEKSGQLRWKSLNEEYSVAKERIEAPALPMAVIAANRISQEGPVRMGESLYARVSLARLIAEDDRSSIKDKIRRDGSRVYNTAYASKSQEEITRGFDDLLDYAMKPYAYSQHAQKTYEQFLNHHKGRHKIVLMLSPYHPALFERMKSQRPAYLQIEREWRELAARSGASVIGSYDPSVVGCGSDEFYDGMHPKESCMTKVYSQL